MWQNPYRKFTLFVIAFLLLTTVFFILYHPLFGVAETLYVRTNGDYLNGRSQPDKHAAVEARFDNGAQVESVSVSGGWVEVVGGETGTVWCKAEYLSSFPSGGVVYRNSSGGRVFIRSEPHGAKTGRVEGNKTVTVQNVVDGWGYIGTGWVDLSYFSKED